MKKAHTGLWIPLSILYNDQLTAAERILAAEVKALDRGTGCYASNEHLGRALGVKPRRVRQMILSLVDRGIFCVANPTSVRRRISLGASAEIVFDAAMSVSDGDADRLDCREEAKTENRNDLAANLGSIQPQDPAVSRQPTRSDCATETTAKLQNESKNKPPSQTLPKLLPTPAWESWIEFNKMQGRTLSIPTMEAQLRTLNDLHMEGYKVEQVIDQSISSGWKGFFPVRDRKGLPPRQRLDGTEIYNSRNL